MCGIIGIINKTRNVAPNILLGLARLEYRGYDSAGLAVINASGMIDVLKTKGKIASLEEEFRKNPVSGSLAIGHTRWATHGKVNVANSHPHYTDSVAVVHNGIIENYLELKISLENDGFKFNTDTDTEVIPVLITSFLKQGFSEVNAVLETIKRLTGAFAIAVIFRNNGNLLIGARKGSPLVVGFGDDEYYIGSDSYSLTNFTKRIAYLKDGDVAVITLESGVRILDGAGKEVQRQIKISSLSNVCVDKDEYRHFMLKEIHEQPFVVGSVINSYIDIVNGGTLFSDVLGLDLVNIDKIFIVACGTSYYAGFISKYLLEKYADIQVEVEIASEFRYRNIAFSKNNVFIFISQSGETADTLAAMRFAKEQNQKVISVINAEESTMEHLSDFVIKCHAGIEIGVASTKAFTTQLAALSCLVLHLAIIRTKITPEARKEMALSLFEVAGKISLILENTKEIENISKELALVSSVLYIGRNTSYGVALEGALKLKELSYIHAEGIAAGELKHGPIALIDEHTPVVVVAPYDNLFEKTTSNIEEIIARGAKVILISTAKGCARFKGSIANFIKMPESSSFITPILYAIPVQLLAYFTATYKGTDVDQPRNLAKSVTVE